MYARSINMPSEQETPRPSVWPSPLQSHWPIPLSWVILGASLAVGPWSVQGMSKLWTLLMYISTGVPLFKVTQRFGIHALSNNATRSYWIVAGAWWAALGVSIQLPNAASFLTWIGTLVWTVYAGVATFRRIPAAPSVTPQQPHSSSSEAQHPELKAPSPVPATSSSSHRWPITLSWVCLGLSFGIRFLWKGQPEVSEPSDIRGSALNLVAQFGWAAVVVAQTFGEALLFFVTRRFGNRTLVTGSARSARGVALAWLLVTGTFFRMQPETGLALAPAALVWIGIATTIRPRTAPVAPSASGNDTSS